MKPRAALGAALIVAAAMAGCSQGTIDVVELAPRALFEGLIAHWTFDDGAGTVVTDSVHTYNGNLLTAANWKPADEHPGFGGFLHFDTSPQSGVQVPMFFQPNASWSVAGWIRAPFIPTTVDVYGTIMSTENPLTAGGPPPGGWELNLRITSPTDNNPETNPSAYQYAYWQGPTTSDYSFQECECYVPDQWAHIAGVFDTDSQTISLYHNGIFAGSKSPKPNILPGTDTLYIGRWPRDDTRHLTGDLDDFVVYNRALTQPEIKQLARAPLPATPPP